MHTKIKSNTCLEQKIGCVVEIYTCLQQKWRLFFYFLFNKMCIMNIDRMVNVRNKMSSKTTHVFVKVTVNIRYVTWKYFMIFVQFHVFKFKVLGLFIWSLDSCMIGFTVT